jgi:hypothetical protein
MHIDGSYWEKLSRALLPYSTNLTGSPYARFFTRGLVFLYPEFNSAKTAPSLSSLAMLLVTISLMLPYLESLQTRHTEKNPTRVTVVSALHSVRTMFSACYKIGLAVLMSSTNCFPFEICTSGTLLMRKHMRPARVSGGGTT